MDRDDIHDRLHQMVQLCKDTEPDVDKMNNNRINSIFSSQLIDSLEMYKTTQSEYEYNDHFDMADVMKKANSIWKLRKKWEEFQKDGKDFSIFTEEQEMMEDVEDCLANAVATAAPPVPPPTSLNCYNTLDKCCCCCSVVYSAA